MLSSKPTVSLLEQTHNEYDFHKETWQTIQDIRDGAIAISKKIRTYLPKRPGEAEDLYQLRIAKASWTPVMTTAIREFVVKLLSAPIHLEGTDSEFWKAFKDDTNGKGRDENDLLTRLFGGLLYFGRVYIAVDRAVLPKLPRSKFEEQLVKAIPRVVLYDPLQVTNWGDGWVQTKEITQECLPLEEPKTICTWRIWTPVSIYTYRATVKLAGDAVTAVWKQAGWVPAKAPEATAELTSKVDHQMGKMPILMKQLPADLWTGNNVYLKQLQHFRIESSWTDAGVMAGTIQRVFTPSPPVNTNDPSYVPEEPDYGDLRSDNAHVLIGNGFQFVESSGSAIAALTSQLDTIQKQIRAIVSMTDNTSDGGTQNASGVAKALDREPLEATMKAYGQAVAALYQDVLQLVAVASSQPTSITVGGLDSYSVDTLEEMIVSSVAMKDILTALPKTALKLWFGKLADLLAGSRSATTDAAIAQELEQMWSAGLPPDLLPPKPEDKANVKSP